MHLQQLKVKEQLICFVVRINILESAIENAYRTIYPRRFNIVFGFRIQSCLLGLTPIEVRGL